MLTERRLKIEGMTCPHCVMSVRRELAKVPGVQVKDVQIGTAVVAYEELKVSPEHLRAAIEEAGYRVAG
jgi:copper chaperone